MGADAYAGTAAERVVTDAFADPLYRGRVGLSRAALDDPLVGDYRRSALDDPLYRRAALDDPLYRRSGLDGRLYGRSALDDRLYGRTGLDDRLYGRTALD